MCAKCEKYSDQGCPGVSVDEDVPEDCINKDFCGTEPVRQLRQTQKEARRRADHLLLLMRSQYPEPKTA